MDDHSITDELVIGALSELKVINRYLGGVNATRYAFRKIFSGSINNDYTVLDAGAGSSDVLLELSREFNLKLFSADINKGICVHISENETLRVVNADILRAPFKEKSFDVVHASLLLHHFTHEEIVKMLASFIRLSRRAVVVNDLHRSFFALYGIKLIVTLLSKNRMIRNDAPLSVKRAFRRNELKEMLDSAGILKYKIKWHWAFRWVIIIETVE